MNYDLLIELNQLLRGIFATVEGRAVTSELFDELAESLNKQVHELYAKFGYKVDKVIDRDFVIHMFNLLVEAGGIEVRSAENEPSVYSHLNDIKPSDPTAHHPAFLDDANQYDPVAAEHGTPDVGFPEGWGENLVGNFDGSHWAREFKVLLDLKPEWAKDEGYLTGWFANAIMTGYDKAKQEEYPEGERSEEDYVYVEFYDVQGENVYGVKLADITEITLKFQTLAAAKEFVKLNAFGNTFKSKYYRYYQFEPTTTYKKTEIK